MQPSQLIGKVISREHFDRLHDGLKKAGLGWGWQVVDSPDPHDPKLITLMDLGLEPYIPPALAAPPAQAMPAPASEAAPTPAPAVDDPERLPTLEEYATAGYPIGQYGAFIEREQSYRILRKQQADEQRAAMLAAIERAQQPEQEAMTAGASALDDWDEKVNE